MHRRQQNEQGWDGAGDFHGVKAWLVSFDPENNGFTAPLIPALRVETPFANGTPVHGQPDIGQL